MSSSERASTRLHSAVRSSLHASWSTRSISRGPKNGKRQRLVDLGFRIPSCLRFAPVDFEAGDAWLDRLVAACFDRSRPTLLTSMGVSMYLTRDAVSALLRQVSGLAAGSTFVMSFLVPLDQVDAEIRTGVERAAQGARASGTPWLSFFTPDEMLAVAKEAGFTSVRHVSSGALADRYFAGRSDGLRPPNRGEELLVAAI